MILSSAQLSAWPTEARALAERIAVFVTTSLANENHEPFEQLATEIINWQRSRCRVAAALTPNPPSSLAEVGAVPISFYKELAVGTIADGDESVCFLTSGTTGSGRGRHRLRSTALYDLGALGFARKMVQPFPRRVVALLDDPTRHPESSLSHMVGLFDQHATWLLNDGAATPGALATTISVSTEPLFLAATAFALGFALSDKNLPQLPKGSVLMVTGGFKGRQFAMDPDQLYEIANDSLQPAHLVTEYGMTELSSQLWGHPGEPYTPPPWLRVWAVDPGSGERLPTNQAGQLRFFDLCNLDCALAVETEDFGVIDAEGRVTLLGRLPNSEARGCSLSAEEGKQW